MTGSGTTSGPPPLLYEYKKERITFDSSRNNLRSVKVPQSWLRVWCCALSGAGNRRRFSLLGVYEEGKL
jgi:hypothetical protein